MKEPAKRWLTFANKDRQRCEQIKDSQGLRAIAAFHSRQIIEKSLKAILVCQGQNPPRIHDRVRPAAVVTADELESMISTGRKILERQTRELNVTLPRVLSSQQLYRIHA